LYEGQFIMATTTFSGPVVSKNGFQLPSFTTTQINAIANPATGLMVYNSTTGAVSYYNGTAWV
jgi:hypothetical protein